MHSLYEYFQNDTLPSPDVAAKKKVLLPKVMGQKLTAVIMPAWRLKTATGAAVCKFQTRMILSQEPAAISRLS